MNFSCLKTQTSKQTRENRSKIRKGSLGSSNCEADVVPGIGVKNLKMGHRTVIMAERNNHLKNELQFGKATMYVISELGLQTEPLIHGKTDDSKVFFDKAVFSGKKQNFSRSRAIDFSWKEVSANTIDQAESKIRIVDLDGFAVDNSIKSHVSSEKTRSFADATGQQELVNRPYVCLNSSKLKDMKQVVNENNPWVARPGAIRHAKAAVTKKSATDAFDKMSKRGSEKFEEERFLERQNALQYNYDVNSFSSEERVGNSKDLTLTNNITSENQNDSENRISPYSNLAIIGKNPERPGKCYLKRIFYPKGNSYMKPSNPRCLPQISARWEKHFGAIDSGKQVKKESSSTVETIQQNNSYSRESSQLLLPLNINLMKNSKKQSHHVKSIVKLPTVVDKKTGQVHLSLEAVAFEQGDYNKWSRRRQRRKQPENRKLSGFSFPLITKSER